MSISVSIPTSELVTILDEVSQRTENQIEALKESMELLIRETIGIKPRFWRAAIKTREEAMLFLYNEKNVLFMNLQNTLSAGKISVSKLKEYKKTFAKFKIENVIVDIDELVVYEKILASSDITDRLRKMISSLSNTAANTAEPE